MSSIERRQYPSGTRWVVRFRSNGQSRSKTFTTRAAAKAFQAQIDHERHSTGTVLDPALRRTRLGDWWDEWIKSQDMRPSTRRTYDSARGHLGTLARTEIGSIRPLDIQRWLSGLNLAESTKRTTFNRLRSVLRGAVANGYLASNPADAVKGPPRGSQRDVALTDDQVKAVIAAMPSQGPAALLGAVTGMRIGEVSGLRVKDVDWLRGVVHVRQQRGGAPLKSASSERDLPIGRGVVESLGTAAVDKDPDDHLFATVTHVQRSFKQAADQVGVEPRSTT